MPKFIMTPLVDLYEDVTARLGAGSGAANNLTDTENGKFVKLAGESRYNLAAVGDEIEGQIVALENATQDGFTLGTVRKSGRIWATADGLQGTPGTGTLAVGDFVVTGTPVAKGTSLGTTPAKVCKATAAGTGIVHTWRVVSLGSAGTGAVGTLVLIERV